MLFMTTILKTEWSMPILKRLGQSSWISPICKPLDQTATQMTWRTTRNPRFKTYTQATAATEKKTKVQTEIKKYQSGSALSKTTTSFMRNSKNRITTSPISYSVIVKWRNTVFWDCTISHQPYPRSKYSNLMWTNSKNIQIKNRFKELRIGHFIQRINKEALKWFRCHL